MRFLEQMGGVAMGRPAAVAGLTPAEPHRTTASSSLGLMLSAGGAMGGGSHGTTPSNTSRFYSVDVGRKSSKCRTAASALDPRSQFSNSGPETDIGRDEGSPVLVLSIALNADL